MPIKNGYLETLDKTLCTGCGACANVCTRNAIRMAEDEEGFLYPNIDKDECVNCGLCNTVCPVNDTQCANKQYDQEYFIAIAKNGQESLNCATVGICTMVTKAFLKEGGHVYGAILIEDTWMVKHVSLQNTEDVNKARNSKYAQSHTVDAFGKIKEDLKGGSRVLFIGTPCQVAGLKSLCRRFTNNLYTIDLACHGVYSYRLLKKEIEFWEIKYSGHVTNFRFRSKYKYGYTCGGMINFDLITTDGKKKHIERQGCSSPIYAAYAYNRNGLYYNLRPSCYACYFRSKGRYGDVTVGDSKGVERHYSSYYTPRNERNGISLYSVNSEKGNHLLELIKNEIIKKEINPAFFYEQPAMKTSNRPIPPDRGIVYDLLHNGGDFGATIESILNVDLDKAMNAWKKKFYIKKIKRLIKYYLRLK